jgi:hypothetical protein
LSYGAACVEVLSERSQKSSACAGFV